MKQILKRLADRLRRWLDAPVPANGTRDGADWLNPSDRADLPVHHPLTDRDCAA